MIKTMTLYPAKIIAGILAGFLSVFEENLFAEIDAIIANEDS